MEQFFSHSLMNLVWFVLPGQNCLKLLATSQLAYVVIPSIALQWLWACAQELFVRSPVGQVTEAGENHVCDCAEVETRLFAAELHENQLFSPDVSRAAHHQGFLSERLEGQLFKRGSGIQFFREPKKQEDKGQTEKEEEVATPLPLFPAPLSPARCLRRTVTPVRQWVHLCFVAKRPDVHHFLDLAVNLLGLAGVYQRWDVALQVVFAAQQPSCAGEKGNACTRSTTRQQHKCLSCRDAADMQHLI